MVVFLLRRIIDSHGRAASVRIRSAAECAASFPLLLQSEKTPYRIAAAVFPDFGFMRNDRKAIALVGKRFTTRFAVCIMEKTKEERNDENGL